MAFRRRGPQGDEMFLANAYRSLLGRPIDDVGRAGYLRELRAGRSPMEIAHEIVASDECERRTPVEKSPRRRFPERYRLALDRNATDVCWVFDAEAPEDFDWMEERILTEGYYESPGIWALDIDADKRVMADIVASFTPKRALEFGCSSGAVLRALVDHGIVADGLEISMMAYKEAPPEIQTHIFLGDLLDLDLPRDYDTVFGLDIFEHLNPNRLARYLDALRAVMIDGGTLFTVVPAFGNDPVFGQVFEMYLPEWDADRAAARPFRALHCDDAGYPMNGHLVWAHTDWWVAQFEQAGFRRQPGAEAEIQSAYADHFAAEPARKSCYVFAT
jgi:hypothetical protein